MARNEALRLDRIRRRCDALTVGEREPGCHPEPAVATDAYTLAIDLDEALTVLASLSERKRAIYALKALAPATRRSAASRADSYSTVNRHLVRAARSSGARGRPSRRRKHWARTIPPSEEATESNRAASLFTLIQGSAQE